MTPVSKTGPRPSSLDPRRNWPILVFAILFTSCMAFAYLWFNTNIGRSRFRPSTLDSRPPIWLEAITNVPGYVFIEEPVSEVVKKILATSNILNGTFYRIREDGHSVTPGSSGQKISTLSSNSFGAASSSENRANSSTSSELPTIEIASRSAISDSTRSATASPADRVTVFVAFWAGADRKGLSVVQHTPDICWLGNGWIPLDLGVPKQVQIGLSVKDTPSKISYSDSTALTDGLSTLKVSDRIFGSNITLPFECRTFELRGVGAREMGLWCTLIGGKMLFEPTRYQGVSTQGHDGYTTPYERSLAANHFSQAVKARMQSHGNKQFIRYSVPLTGDWQGALQNLKAFGDAWLEPKAFVKKHL
jgi:hypothetical protein